jgi:hypothetical protein
VWSPGEGLARVTRYDGEIWFGLVRDERRVEMYPVMGNVEKMPKASVAKGRNKFSVLGCPIENSDCLASLVFTRLFSEITTLLPIFFL